MQPQAPFSPSPVPATSPTPGNLPPGYEFITSPNKPQTTRGPSSPVKRALVVLGGLLVLLILFVFIKSLLSGGGNKPQLLSVVQDQQELIHLSTASQQETTLSITNKNFAVTAELGLTSDQSKLLHYASKDGLKLNKKLINRKVSLAVDKQLADASAASTYDTAFRTIMQTKLSVYQSDIKQAYAKTKGRTGRALLKENYSSAQLLSQQLNPAN